MQNTTATVEMNARNLRRAGWRVLFRYGRVVVGRTPGAVPCAAFGAADGARSTTVDRGAWMRRPAFAWDAVDANEMAELQAIERVCYCVSCPDNGCDYCNGTRPIPAR